MDATTGAGKIRKLDKSKLAERKRTTMSTETAIKEISVIDWAESVINGSKKVLIGKAND